MNEELKCPKCGAQMEPFQEGRTQGRRCPKCGTIGLVTTYFSEEELDDTIYCVIVNPQEMTHEKIKILSQLTGKNYLECRKMLEKGGEAFRGQMCVLHVGDDITLKQKLGILTESDIAFRVIPEPKEK